MQVFIYNMDRQNSGLVKSLEDILVRKQELLSFGSIKSEVISKNNGYLILDLSDQEISVLWTAIKMIAKGCSASYWVTDYGNNFKFITLKRATHEFKKFPIKKEVNREIVVDEETAKSLTTSIQSNFKPEKKKEFKKLEKIKLEDLVPSDENFTLDVKFNPDKPLSMAQVGRDKKLIKIPKDSWLVIRGKSFKTNNEEIKTLLVGKEFEYNEDLPSIN